jgi:hypothetical protein
MSKPKGTFTDSSKLENLILYAAGAFLLAFIIGGGLFHWSFFGEYAATAAKTSGWFKLIGISLLSSAAGVMILSDRSSGGAKGGTYIAAAALVILSAWAMIGFTA